jgi:hypothetical protein
MIETIIEKNSFDFDSFVNDIFEFINDIYGIDPAILIQNVEKPSMTDKEASKNLQKRKAADLLKELENGKHLYFPFTQAQITSDSNNIKSVDGTEYEKNSLENLLKGYDTIGYIVSIKNFRFIINSGIHKVIQQSNSSSPIEEIKEIKNSQYEQFNKPMETFLKKFIEK